MTVYPGFFGSDTVPEIASMEDPVVCVHDGITYERQDLEQLGFQEKKDFYPNHCLKKIKEYLCCADKNRGMIVGLMHH